MAYEKDIALVNFYFDSSTVIQYYRERRLTFTSFLSQIGGLLGLCLGFSMVSIVELIYWIFYRICLSLKSRKNINKITKNKVSFDETLNENISDQISTNNMEVQKRRGLKFFSIEVSNPIDKNIYNEF